MSETVYLDQLQLKFEKSFNQFIEYITKFNGFPPSQTHINDFLDACSFNRTDHQKIVAIKNFYVAGNVSEANIQINQLVNSKINAAMTVIDDIDYVFFEIRQQFTCADYSFEKKEILEDYCWGDVSVEEFEVASGIIPDIFFSLTQLLKKSILEYCKAFVVNG